MEWDAVGREARVSMKTCTLGMGLRSPEVILGLITQGNEVERGRGMSTRMNRVDSTVLYVINEVVAVDRSHAGHFQRAQAVTITQNLARTIFGIAIFQRQRSVDLESPVGSSAS